MNLLALGTGAIVGIVIGVVVLILIVAIAMWYISTRNGFVTLENNCEEAFSTIDVYLKKRYDLIPNLVETVKGYAHHESETLEKVVAARNQAMSAATPEEKIAADAQFTQAIRNFNVVTERYPDLKANTNFLDLSNQLKGIESELERSRRYYNGTVKAFNTKISLFPGSLIAASLDLSKKNYFELDSAVERQNVRVSF